MWGRRKNGAKSGGLGAFLDDGSEIEGQYTCAGTVVVNAKIRGELVAKDTLIVGERGIVEASIRAVRIVVRGKVAGNVTASERVELKDGARVTGDIEAPIIVMDAGAVLDGRCRMTKEKAPDTTLALVVPLKA
jgi:cytoskeletal protein CcmA (bactofilin family)